MRAAKPPSRHRCLSGSVFWRLGGSPSHGPHPATELRRMGLGPSFERLHVFHERLEIRTLRYRIVPSDPTLSVDENEPFSVNDFGVAGIASDPGDGNLKALDRCALDFFERPGHERPSCQVR